MYFTLGFKENIENLYVLASSAGTGEIKNLNDLKAGYVNYIRKHQSQALIGQQASLNIQVIHSHDDKEKLAEAFNIESKLNDLKQQSLIEDFNFAHAELATRMFAKTLSFLESSAPEIFTLISLVFNYCFFAHSSKASGGSTSGGMGILWLNPKPSWTIQDYAELLVHELTHQLLFVDERRHRHYVNYSEIGNPANFAYSTILNRSRPLDKVIHSYFVGSNIIQYRAKYFSENSAPQVHPPTDKINESLSKTFVSFEERQMRLFTSRLKHLLNNQMDAKHDSAIA